MRLCTLILLAAIPASAAAEDPPRRPVRVWLQLIEVPHATFTELMDAGENSGPAIHARVMQQAKTGKAKFVETSMVTVRSGRRATVESVREMIYPTEFTIPWDFGYPTNGTADFDPGSSFPISRGGKPDATAFETRYVGITLDVEPTADLKTKRIHLRLTPEIVDLVGFTAWNQHRDQWGENSLRMPMFETWTMESVVSLQSGSFELFNVFSPQPTDEASTSTRKILCFVRADILSP